MYSIIVLVFCLRICIPNIHAYPCPGIHVILDNVLQAICPRGFKHMEHKVTPFDDSSRLSLPGWENNKSSSLNVKLSVSSPLSSSSGLSRKNLRARSGIIEEIGLLNQPQYVTTQSPIVRVLGVTNEVVVIVFGVTSQNIPFTTAGKSSLYTPNKAQLIFDITQSSINRGRISSVNVFHRFELIASRWAMLFRDQFIQQLTYHGLGDTPDFYWEPYPRIQHHQWFYYFEASPVGETIWRSENHILDPPTHHPLVYPDIAPGHPLALPVAGGEDVENANAAHGDEDAG